MGRYGKGLEMQSVRKFGALLAVFPCLWLLEVMGVFLGERGESEKFAVGVSAQERV